VQIEWFEYFCADVESILYWREDDDEVHDAQMDPQPHTEMVQALVVHLVVLVTCVQINTLLVQ